MPNLAHFTHDCDHCRYLGTVPTLEAYSASKLADLYLSECGDTLIARVGNEGQDYYSMPRGLVQHMTSDHPLRAAAKLLELHTEV